MIHRFGFILALAIGAPGALAFGDDGKDGKKETWETKLLEVLRARQLINDAEYNEIATLALRLKAEDEDVTVTRGLDALATTTPPPAQGATIKAAAGEGITITDGDFRVTMTNKIQFRWTYTDFDNDAPIGTPGGSPVRPDTNTLSIPRARTYLDGSAFDPNITWRLAMDWTEGGASGAPIKDAWVNWNFWNKDDNHVGMRLGQQKTRFGRVATASTFGQEFVDRDPRLSYQWPEVELRAPPVVEEIHYPVNVRRVLVEERGRVFYRWEVTA